MASELSTNEYDRVCRVLMSGDSAVGKSSLVVRFKDGTYTDEHVATLGLDFTVRTVCIEGNRIKLQIWDMAGQERYRAISSAYFRIGEGVIFVYDVTNQESLDNLPDWLQRADSYGRGHKERLLIGNKSDMINERVVSYEDAKAFADHVGIPYLETSAKNADNVERAFFTLTSSLLKHPPPIRPGTTQGTVKLSGRKPGFLDQDCCNCTPDKQRDHRAIALYRTDS